MHFRDLDEGQKTPSKKEILTVRSGGVQLNSKVTLPKVVRDANEVSLRCQALSGFAGSMLVGNNYYLSLIPLQSLWDISPSTLGSLNAQVVNLFERREFGTHHAGYDGRIEYLRHWKYSFQHWSLDLLWKDFPSDAWFHLVTHEHFLPALRARLEDTFKCGGLRSIPPISRRRPYLYIPTLAVYYALEVTLLQTGSLDALGITPFAYHMNSIEDNGRQYGHVLETDTHCIVNLPFVLFHVRDYADTFEKLFLLTCYELSVDLSKSLTMWRHARKVRSYLEDHLPKHSLGGLTEVTDGEGGKLTLSKKGRLSIFK